MMTDERYVARWDEDYLAGNWPPIAYPAQYYQQLQEQQQKQQQQQEQQQQEQPKTPTLAINMDASSAVTLPSFLDDGDDDEEADLPWIASHCGDVAERSMAMRNVDMSCLRPVSSPRAMMGLDSPSASISSSSSMTSLDSPLSSTGSSSAPASPSLSPLQALDSLYVRNRHCYRHVSLARSRHFDDDDDDDGMGADLKLNEIVAGIDDDADDQAEQEEPVFVMVDNKVLDGLRRSSNKKNNNSDMVDEKAHYYSATSRLPDYGDEKGQFHFWDAANNDDDDDDDDDVKYTHHERKRQRCRSQSTFSRRRRTTDATINNNNNNTTTTNNNNDTHRKPTSMSCRSAHLRLPRSVVGKCNDRAPRNLPVSVPEWFEGNGHRLEFVLCRRRRRRCRRSGLTDRADNKHNDTEEEEEELQRVDMSRVRATQVIHVRATCELNFDSDTYARVDDLGLDSSGAHVYRVVRDATLCYSDAKRSSSSCSGSSIHVGRKRKRTDSGGDDGAVPFWVMGKSRAKRLWQSKVRAKPTSVAMEFHCRDTGHLLARVTLDRSERDRLSQNNASFCMSVNVNKDFQLTLQQNFTNKVRSSAAAVKRADQVYRTFEFALTAAEGFGVQLRMRHATRADVRQQVPLFSSAHAAAYKPLLVD